MGHGFVACVVWNGFGGNAEVEASVIQWISTT